MPRNRSHVIEVTLRERERQTERQRKREIPRRAHALNLIVVVLHSKNLTLPILA